MYMICAFAYSFLRSVTLWWIHGFIHWVTSQFIPAFIQSVICSIVHTFTIIHIIHIIIHAPSAPGGHQVVTRQFSPCLAARSWTRAWHSAYLQWPWQSTTWHVKIVANRGGACEKNSGHFFCVSVLWSPMHFGGVLKLESNRSWKMRLEVDLGSDNFSVVEMQIRLQEVLTPSWKIQPLGPCSMP